MTSMDSNSKDGAPKYFFQQQNETLLRSLQEFEAQFPTEETAREDVKAWLQKENLLFCHNCKSQNLEKKHGARVLKCLDCSNKTWITAGTFFHHAKRIKPRLAAIWLMERGFIVSSSQLHKLTDIAQSSAFNILKRVAIVIEAYMERNVCEIPTAVFSKVIYKRSKETPARAHPLAEQEEIDALEQEQQKKLQKQLLERQQKELNSAEIASLPEQQAEHRSPSDPNIASSTNITQPAKMTDLTKDPDTLSQQTNMNMQDSQYTQLSQQEKVLYDLLSENPISFEELYTHSNMSVGETVAALMILEIAGLVSSLPGNNYIRCAGNKNSKDTIKNQATSDALAEFGTIALAVESFIRNNFHGISRKYLQNYLSAYWYHVDRNFWQIGSLLSACFRFHPIKVAEIITYVTPPITKYCER